VSRKRTCYLMTLVIDAMGIFLGSLIIFGLCCLVMSLGMLIDGRELSGGCGKSAPGKLRCEGCPKRNRHGANDRKAGGEYECRDH
jgi:hypothetical protein